MAPTEVDLSEPMGRPRVDSKLDVIDFTQESKHIKDDTSGKENPAAPVDEDQLFQGSSSSDGDRADTDIISSSYSNQESHAVSSASSQVEPDNFVPEETKLQDIGGQVADPIPVKETTINSVSSANDKAEEHGTAEAATEPNRQLKPAPKVSALIFDIGDVLCNWTAPENLPVAPAMLHRFRKTRFWYEYDLGILSQDECYGLLAAQYGVSVSDIAEAFNKARDTLTPNYAVFEKIRELKQTYHNVLKIYLMSNIPMSEWNSLKEKAGFDWASFDGVFTSSQTGMCKPELRFFRHVLEKAGMKPTDVVLIDDNAENVLAARSLGIRSWRYKDAEGLKQFMDNIFHDPIERGREYLHKNAKEMWSVTPQGREVRDNFAQLFLYEAVEDM